MGNAVKEKTNIFISIVYTIADFWKRLGEPDIQQSTVFNNLDDEKEAAAEEAIARSGDVMFKESKAQEKKKSPVQKVEPSKKVTAGTNTKTQTRLNSKDRRER